MASFSLDSLYCDEEQVKWGEIEDESVTNSAPDHEFLIETEENEEEELNNLLFKEKEFSGFAIETDPFVTAARREAAEWILKVNGYYGFSTLTAILALNYLDRFFMRFEYQQEKPWMMHLASVTALSLAAKVEETNVPLLLDLQLRFNVDSKHVFETKTIQKMELLMLSTLEWKMNLVTPLSFVDHVMRRLRLKNRLYWDFRRRCERLLLSLIADCRGVRYEASVLATATMIHVLHQLHPCNVVDYHSQLLHILRISQEKLKECCELISEIASSNTSNDVPSSPNGVIDSFLSSSDGSNDSWTVESCVSPPKKKFKTQEHHMKLPSFPLGKAFLELVGSPHY